MQTAIEGTTVVEIEEFVKRPERAESDSGSVAVVVSLQCRICEHPMALRVPSSLKRVAHFYHRSGAKDCPSSKAAAKKYSILAPRRPDPTNAQRVRSEFKANWPVHWHEFTTITDHGSIDEFIVVLERANRLRVWEYRDLEEWHVPYLLTALADFPRKNSIPNADGSPQRGHYLHFWFEGAARTLEGRWNELSRAPELKMARFRDPGKKRRPSSAYVVAIDTVKLNPGFVTGSFTPGPGVPSKMAAFFKKHPKLFR